MKTTKTTSAAAAEFKVEFSRNGNKVIVFIDDNNKKHYGINDIMASFKFLEEELELIALLIKDTYRGKYQIQALRELGGVFSLPIMNVVDVHKVDHEFRRIHHNESFYKVIYTLESGDIISRDCSTYSNHLDLSEANFKVFVRNSTKKEVITVYDHSEAFQVHLDGEPLEAYFEHASEANFEIGNLFLK